MQIRIKNKILKISVKKLILLLFVIYFIYLLYPSIFLGRYFFKENIIKKAHPSRIYDRNGKLVAELFSKKYGNIRVDKIPELMSQVLLFVEDNRFYYHFGVDPISVSRAFLKNIYTASIKEGGSTITQQLARIIINDRSKTIRRKITEANLAVILEIKLSKEEILTEYMNRVYLGHGAYGFGNAARFYFNKDVHKLNLFECILLSTLPAAPSGYSPIKKIDKSFIRVKIIIDTLFDEMPSFMNNVNSKKLYRQMSRYYGRLNRSPTETFFGEFSSEYPTITEYVRNLLAKKFDEVDLYSGGYKIYTTIDAEYQKIVENITEKYIAEKRKTTQPRLVIPDDKDKKKKFYTAIRKNKVQKSFSKRADILQILSLLYGNPLDLYPANSPKKFKSGLTELPQKGLQAAVVGVELNTGKILFVKGGVQFSAGNQFNRAFNGYRQTGSSIKPIIYSTGIENNRLRSTTLLNDSPQFYEQALGKDKDWLPENYDYQYKGEVTVRQALARSINICAILAAEKTGMDLIADQYKEFFFPEPKLFQKRFKSDLSIAIGSLEFTPLEVSLAYSAFVQRGTIHRPRVILKVTDRNDQQIFHNWEKNWEKYPLKRTVFNSDVAEVMVSLLENSGRFSRVTSAGFYKKFAGKTGTTNYFKDAWFIGFTPEIVMAIWVGFDNHVYGMGKGSGGSGMASALWGQIMKDIYKNKKTGIFKYKHPRAVKARVCLDSQNLARKDCPKKSKDLFTSSNYPKKKCQMNHSKKMFISSGLIEDNFD
jgi:penicillin-binding protein 1A